MDPDDRDFGDPSRRTYLAEERTLLAWWRSGLAALAVSLAVGRLIPALLEVSETPFLILGVGYALMGVALFVVGSYRHAAVRAALAAGRFSELAPGLLWALTAALLALALGTVVLLLIET